MSNYRNILGFEAFKQRVIDLGLTTQNTYLFIRGHDLLNRVTIKILQYVGDPLYKNRIQEFKKVRDTKGLRDYDLHLKEKNYEMRLKENNNSFNASAFYQKIINNITEAFQ
jgi:hypothetical protein